MMCEHGIENCVYCADEKPLHIAHSAYPSNGEWVGFICKWDSPNRQTVLGRFQIAEEHWEEFKQQMELIATIAWSWN
jgi:hypothetical protein